MGKILGRLQFKYRMVGKAKNYEDTPEIKRRRHEYLVARRSEEYKDHLFVWQDESYVHQNHVRAQSWYSEGMVVKQNTSGRKYIIVHAGCKVNVFRMRKPC